MTDKTLILLADTNLFIQCKPLSEIIWKDWDAFAEVHIVISRPVLSEIDDHKNRGNDRLGRRARKASTLFREIILSPQSQKLIRDESPRVIAYIRQDIRPSESLNDRLDYREPDDQLVGIAYALTAAKPDAVVRVLTNDMGPLASAVMVGVEIASLPDEWLLPPETSESDKRIKALQDELNRFKSLAPEVNISFLDSQGTPCEKLTIEVHRCAPLQPDQINDLVVALKERHPIASEFSSNPKASQFLAAGFQFRPLNFKPPSQEDITHYLDSLYPSWLESCEAQFKELHKTLQEMTLHSVFHFQICNDGTRPAENLLTTITSSGNYSVMPTNRDGTFPLMPEPVKLRAPPKPPEGEWEAAPSVLDLLGRQYPLLEPSPIYDDLLRHVHRREHDPEAFYFKPSRPVVAVHSYSLECDRLRHQTEPTSFRGCIYIDISEKMASGVLECRVQADNLNLPASLSVPIEIIFRDIDVFEKAERLVKQLMVQNLGL